MILTVAVQVDLRYTNIELHSYGIQGMCILSILTVF